MFVPDRSVGNLHALLAAAAMGLAVVSAHAQSGALLASPFGTVQNEEGGKDSPKEDKEVLDVHNSGRVVTRAAIIPAPSHGQTFTARHNGPFSRFQISTVCSRNDSDVFLTLYSLSTWTAAPLLTSRIARDSLSQECGRDNAILTFDVSRSGVRAIAGEQYLFVIHSNLTSPTLHWLAGGNDYRGGSAVMKTLQARFDFHFSVYVLKQ